MRPGRPPAKMKKHVTVETATDYLLEPLVEWGVTSAHGFPGDGLNGILGVFRRAKYPIRSFDTSHEMMASFMACSHAKWKGEVGVSLATSGPGAIHFLNGL